MRHIDINAIVILIIVSCQFYQEIVFCFYRLGNRIKATVASDAYLTLHFQMKSKRVFVSHYNHFGIYITTQNHVLIKMLEKSIIELILKLMTAR